jgi:hypothetical protein
MSLPLIRNIADSNCIYYKLIMRPFIPNTYTSQEQKQNFEQMLAQLKSELETSCKERQKKMNEKMTEEINEKIKIIWRQQEQIPKGGKNEKKIINLATNKRERKKMNIKNNCLLIFKGGGGIGIILNESDRFVCQWF